MLCPFQLTAMKCSLLHGACTDSCASSSSSPAKHKEVSRQSLFRRRLHREDNSRVDHNRSNMRRVASHLCFPQCASQKLLGGCFHTTENILKATLTWVLGFNSKFTLLFWCHGVSSQPCFNLLALWAGDHILAQSSIWAALLTRSFSPV